MLGGAKRVSMAQQLIRAGEGMGFTVNIFSHELNACQPIASVGTVIVGKKYNNPDAINEIDEIVKKHHIDVILPFIDPATTLAARYATLNENVFVPSSNETLCKAMFNKISAAKIFDQHKFPIPKTYSPCDIQFPAILKPATGSASKGILIANSNDDLANALLPLDEYIIQEYIANRDEYTVDCYVGTRDAEVKCACVRRRIETAGGEVTRTQTARISEIEEAAKTVLTTLGFRGAVTLQFLHDKDTNRFLLMEINPRLGGGVICSIAAGADIAMMILQEHLGLNASPCNDWRDKTLMTRFFKEVIFFNDDNNSNQ